MFPAQDTEKDILKMVHVVYLVATYIMYRYIYRSLSFFPAHIYSGA